MVICKFHIRGTSEADHWNSFFYSEYIKKRQLPFSLKFLANVIYLYSLHIMISLYQESLPIGR